MNAVKYVFLEASSLLCPFHIEKNVKAKCKIYVASKNKVMHLGIQQAGILLHILILIKCNILKLMWTLLINKLNIHIGV